MMIISRESEAKPLTIGQMNSLILSMFLGVFFAVSTYFIWNIQGRWFVIVIIGFTLLCLSFVFISNFSEFLFISTMFCLPLAGFVKWLFLDGFPQRISDAAPLEGAVGIGIIDFLLFGLYLSWFFKIFITKTEPMPHFIKFDILVLLLLITNILSLQRAPYLSLGVFAIIHLLKHILLYFYVSRNFMRRHIRWLVIAIFFAIALEAGLGIFQNQTGKIKGLILDKGAASDIIDYQYTVGGIENFTRATGTAYDSHSLGGYMTFLIPYAFVFSLYASSLKIRVKFVLSIFFILGFSLIIISFSRSAWISASFSLCVISAILLSWGGKKVFISLLPVVCLILMVMPMGFHIIVQRFIVSSPMEHILPRLEQYTAAWNMIKQNPIFGNGIGNYMSSLPYYNHNWSSDLPVHNVLLWVAADTGITGVFAFYGLLFAALRKSWKNMWNTREPICQLNLAIFAGVLAYCIDGLTNPLFRESIVYMMLWFSIALAVALQRINDENSLHAAR